MLPRAEVLAAHRLAAAVRRVAGTHGKTTTSSMLALILVEAGLHPSFLIGGDVNEIGTNAVWDDGEWLVVEADESDGTFSRLDAGHRRRDQRRGRPPRPLRDRSTPCATAFAAFRGLGRGHRWSAPTIPSPPTSAGPHGADRSGTDAGCQLSHRRRCSSAGARCPSAVGPTTIRLARVSDRRSPGSTTPRNAAVAAVAAARRGAPLDAVAAALARFAAWPGASSSEASAGGVTFVDDYAHLPGEVRAALAAARDGGWRRVVAVFQPHRYTRTAELVGEFGRAFDGADVVVVTDVYAAGEAPMPGVTGRLVADAVRRALPGRTDVRYVPGAAELAPTRGARCSSRATSACTLGAGDLTTLPDELMADRAGDGER